MAEKLKIQISRTQIPATRIGNIKPPLGSRPRLVRIHSPEIVDSLKIYKSRSHRFHRSQGAHLILSEDLSRRERIQRDLFREL